VLIGLREVQPFGAVGRSLALVQARATVLAEQRGVASRSALAGAAAR
jgi:hypothetical protein